MLKFITVKLILDAFVFDGTSYINIKSIDNCN